MTTLKKPFSHACENNKQPILQILVEAFKDSKNVLEIGSGTGQHAVYFAENLPYLTWQPSDRPENLNGMKIWFDEANLSNIKSPVELDVINISSDVGKFDAVFSANTFHIMSKFEVECFFKVVKSTLLKDGKFCVYGPFNYGGNYTSESNKRFDIWLNKRDPDIGIKDFEWVNSLAESLELNLVKDYVMPANNRLIEWNKL